MINSFSLVKFISTNFTKGIFCLAIGLCLTACTHNSTRIAILHTNDMHGHLQNFDKLKYIKDSLLNIYDTVLLVSAGDMFSGNPYVDNYKDKGYPIIDIMNKVGYNVAALGNHEFDYGQAVLEERINQANFPILANNITSDNSHFITHTPNYQLNYKDINIMFLSVIETESNGHPSTHPKNLHDLSFINSIEHISTLLKDANKDLHIIGLTHHGYENDSILSVNHPVFNVIIGGHSHTLIEEPTFINNVLVAQAGQYMQHLGLVELEFKDNKLTNRNYKLIRFNDIKSQDNEISALIEQYEQNELLDEVIATNTQTLNRDELGCLYTDAQLNVLKTDIALQNYWGIRVDSLAAGPITRKDILVLDPFRNKMIVYTMRANEIKALLKAGYELSDSYDLFIAGGSYNIKTDTNNKLVDINIFDNKGLPLLPNKDYRVAVNSYVASSYNFSCADTGTATVTVTSDNIMQYLQSIKTVDYAGCNRVSVNPPVTME